MMLEQQVASLKLSKCLKELGVKQESAFYWVCPQRKGLKWTLEEFPEHWVKLGTGNIDSYWGENGYFAAFTVAELGEMLPKSFRFENAEWFLDITCDLNELRYINYRDYNSEDYLPEKGICADTEANARAKMLIHLIEKGMVTP